jgi:hypothetical protein
MQYETVSTSGTKKLSDDSHIPGVVNRVKQALGVDSLPQVAELLDEPLSTVKSWSARDGVPLGPLVRIAARSGRTVDWLIFGDRLILATAHGAQNSTETQHPSVASPSPPAYSGGARAHRREAPLIEDSERLGLAISAVQSGLRAIGFDPDALPIGRAVQAVYETLPPSVPGVPAKR